MRTLENQYRTKELLTSIFSAAEERPIYLTNYRGGLNADMTDEQLMEGLFFGLECGATLVDIMGDTFALAPEELTMDKKAIAKQMQFIDKVHERGGEVLMSSHVYTYQRGNDLEYLFAHYGHDARAGVGENRPRNRRYKRGNT